MSCVTDPELGDLRRATFLQYVRYSGLLSKSFYSGTRVGVLRAAITLVVWPHFVHRLDTSGPIIGVRKVGMIRKYRMGWNRNPIRTPSIFVFNLCVPPESERQGRALRLGQELLRIIDLCGYSAYCVCRVDNARLMSAYQDFGFAVIDTLSGGKTALLERTSQR